MNVICGYCGISAKKQNIERQERNILAAHTDAWITKETYTGTKLNRLLLATKQIELAFSQAQKEGDDLHQRQEALLQVSY